MGTVASKEGLPKSFGAQMLSQWASDSWHGITKLWGQTLPFDLALAESFLGVLLFSFIGLGLLTLPFHIRRVEILIPQWVKVKVLTWVSEKTLNFYSVGTIKTIVIFEVWLDIFYTMRCHESMGAQERVLWYEYGPHRFICLNTWSLVSDTILESCGTICIEDLFADIEICNILWLYRVACFNGTPPDCSCNITTWLTVTLQ